ncbi:MAG: Undecaprenyl-phosphate 4-deoxy-4-formamido-L-arabinose transferase [Pseudomonadota bacterium]|jgi:dolichol-phosphate mannosyltransferase
MISVVVPVHNEALSLEILTQKIVSELEGHVPSWEILFVDDGSTDDSWRVITELCKRNTQVSGIRHRFKAGKSDALSNGVNAARFDTVVCLDGDLQDRPDQIPKLLHKLDEGFDMVVGWRQNRKDSLEKKLMSRVFNFFLSYSSGLKLHDHNCGLKAFRRTAFSAMKIYGSLHRFLPLLVFQQGYRVTEVPIVHDARRTGSSRYGFSRYVGGLSDFVSVTALSFFRNRPGHLFISFGVGLLALGLLSLIYLTCQWLALSEPIGNRPLLFFGMLFVLAGIQLISLGVFAEFILSKSLRLKQHAIIAEKYPQQTRNTPG